MSKKLKILDVVALLKDIPEKNLITGQVGRQATGSGRGKISGFSPLSFGEGLGVRLSLNITASMGKLADF